jgi:hypothetical protein
LDSGTGSNSLSGTKPAGTKARLTPRTRDGWKPELQTLDQKPQPSPLHRAAASGD